MNMARSNGLPIDSLGNAAGSTNLQEFVGEREIYAQLLEAHNYNRTFHDFNVNRQVGLPATSSNSSGDRNGMLANTDNRSSSSCWGELLLLMEAPSAAPENFMANSSTGATNDHVQKMKAQYAAQQSRTFNNINVAAGPAMLSSGSRGRSLMQSAMEAPPVRIENKSSSVNGYAIPDVSSQESSRQMQPNAASSLPLTQSYYIASNHRHNTGLSHTMQHRAPVHYQPHDNMKFLNCVDVKAASSIRSTSQLAPLTPQPTKRSHQHSATINIALDQRLNQDKVLKDDLVASSITYSSQLAPATPQPSKAANNYQCQATQRDRIQNQERVQKVFAGLISNESVTHDSQQIIDLDPPSAAIGTSLKEKADNKESQDIDLNKTPSKKAPRRKKHRPRVIVENKRPRKRRPAKAKLGPDGLPVPKRKYVRKTKHDVEEIPEVDARKTTKGCTPEPASKYCRRSLNFELQGDKMETTKLDEQQERQNQSHSPMKEHQTEIPYVSTSYEAKRASVLCKTTENGYHTPAYQTLDAGSSQPCFQDKLESRQMFQMIVQERQKMVSEYIQSRASKRDFGLSEELGGAGASTNLISSQLLCKKIFQNEYNNTNNMPCQYYTGTHKRMKVENLRHTTSSSSQISTKDAKRSPSELQINRHPLNPLLEANGRLFNQYPNQASGKPKGDLCYSSGELNAAPVSPFTNPLRQPTTTEASVQQEKAAEKEDRISTLRILNSLKARACANLLLQTPPKKANLRTPSLMVEMTDGNNHAIVPVKRHTTQKTGSRVKQKNTVQVDDIMKQLERLNLNSTKREMLKDEQKALVLYKGDDRIIPYEGYDLLKRRKARPRVDLDPETDRLWKLLMGKEVNDDEKQTDEQKAKWWEEQRDIFRGRADSFIARMHLIQGDRRFSPWKGSVVDSVIGVFLTQNVTDHLSSSAFMSLAARFRPRKIIRSITSGKNKPDGLVEDVDIRMIETNDKTQSHEKLTTCNGYNRILGDPLDQQKQKLASVDFAEQSVKANWKLDDVILLRCPTDSSGEAQSLLMSDSQTERKTNGNQSTDRYSRMPSIIEEIENLIRVPNFTSQEYATPCYGVGKNVLEQLHNAESSNNYKQLDRVHFNGLMPVPHPIDLNRPQWQDQNISSSIHKIPAARRLGLSGETDCIYMLKKQPTKSLHSASDDSTRIAVQNYNHQSPCCNHQQDGNMDTQFGSKSNKGSLQSQNKMVGDQTAYNLPGHTYSSQKDISLAENGVQIQKKANLKEQDRSSSEASRKNVSKEKAAKTEGEKMTVDWDSLRRQVKPNINLKRRNQDTRDSMDYEALRLADVGEISKAIKERGMNNMLADRMKDFLNRLVRDHGSIDLEWLRDAPPDKAKDYLLSIRGLGLKSVECIRLLTLHQHAFPVDTNVGRIAVRLGWVPLQPLPESLQLHLLEMYPVLETIQKYLWPRLCNLDQRTLYELHYQLITFGKVFCTKSKPNCNACPMRGECRHFASAFASSRLALPGPDERSVVTSSIHNETRNPDVTVSTIPLHSLLDVPPEEATSSHRTCEPIVEEPTTPEPESPEISETDIEEAFFEDPDEIPTIRLNVEEFTQNLQNFMQENMELQEGDMSRALVTLNPKFASIPTPKLKNISRLRTEHHVYELPDAHPLLRKLEKREPDDPSPYLLAIWSPGETVNSVQHSEEICSFQENGGLCSQKTCITCNKIRESNSETVRGTLLIPCRTATRGSFPLNGTYFQVNEVFADHESSLNPIDVPRTWIWNLPKRTVYFGTSVTTIFRGMSTEDIQHCFWRGFVCVRGFEQNTRTPRPLMARLHFPASKQVRQKRNETRQTGTELANSNNN